MVDALVGVPAGERFRRRPKIAGRLDSPSERRILKAAHHYRVPRSRFLGRVIEPGEPEWLDEDIEAALEWIAYQDSLCSGCGNPKSECWDPDRDGTYEAIAVQCFACAARDAENRRASEARASDRMGSSSFDGLYFAVTERG